MGLALWTLQHEVRRLAIGRRIQLRFAATLLVAGFAVGCRDGVTDRSDPSAAALSLENVVHLKGKATSSGNTSSFELWFDRAGKQFSWRIGSNERLEVSYSEGVVTENQPGDDPMHGSFQMEFGAAVLQHLTAFDYALDPVGRSYFSDLGMEEVSGVTYRVIKDRNGARYLLDPISFLPILIQFGSSETQFAYDVVEVRLAPSVPAAAYEVSTPGPAAIVSSIFEWDPSTPEAFKAVYDFAEFDVYWAGLSFGNWVCRSIERQTLNSPVQARLAELENQPGKSRKYVTVRYEPINAADTSERLNIETNPKSALIMGPSNLINPTPMTVAGYPAWISDLGEGGEILVVNYPDSQIVITGEDETVLVGVANHLTRVQDASP